MTRGTAWAGGESGVGEEARGEEGDDRAGDGEVLETSSNRRRSSIEVVIIGFTV